MDALRRDVSVNKSFIDAYRATIQHLDLDAMTSRLNELDIKVESLTSGLTEGRSGAQQGLTGTIKAPILATLEPADYRAFRDMCKAHAKVHNWSDEVAKQQLLLSVSPKIYSTLKSAVSD